MGRLIIAEKHSVAQAIAAALGGGKAEDGWIGYISAYKWHLQPLSAKQAWILTLIGISFFYYTQRLP